MTAIKPLMQSPTIHLHSQEWGYISEVTVKVDQLRQYITEIQKEVAIYRHIPRCPQLPKSAPPIKMTIWNRRHPILKNELNALAKDHFLKIWYFHKVYLPYLNEPKNGTVKQRQEVSGLYHKKYEKDCLINMHNRFVFKVILNDG